MDATSVGIVLIILGLVFGAFCAYLADEKGRSAVAWFMLGLLFGIIALLVLMALPKERPPTPKFTPRQTSRNKRAARSQPNSASKMSRQQISDYLDGREHQTARYRKRREELRQRHAKRPQDS